jgi:hypothetical protein
MKDLIFVFSVDVGYGVEESYTHICKAQTLPRAIGTLQKFLNKDLEPEDKEISYQDVKDEYIDNINVFDLELNKEIYFTNDVREKGITKIMDEITEALK